MSNRFQGRGNLAEAPQLKFVTVDGEQRQVADMRIYCDRPVPDGNEGYKDKGGFWMNVSTWGRRAEHAARVLTKGMRIKVEGTLTEDAWEKDGQEKSQLELTADDISLDLSRIESVTLRKRKQPENAQRNTDLSDAALAEEAAYGD